MKQVLFPIFLFSFAALYSADIKRDSVWYHYPGVGVTANRYEKDLFETHVPTSAIHERRIVDQGISNLADLVTGESGVTSVTTGPWSQKWVIRGLTSSHVLTLVDGMRLDVLRSYGDHAPLVDVDHIERVEIIRGPGSVLYGSNAVAGVVNILTKTAPRTDLHYLVNTHVGFQYASANSQYSESAGVRGKYGDVDFMLQLNHRKADDIRTPSGTLANTAFSGYEAAAKFGIHLTSRQEVRLSTHFTRMDDVGVPINPFATSARFTDYNRNRVALDYEWRPSNSRWTHIKTNAYYQTGVREFGARLYHVPNGSLFINNHINAHRDVKTGGGFVQFSVIPFDHALLTFGVDGFTEFDDTRRSIDPVVVDATDTVKKDPPASLVPPTPKSNRYGAAAFGELEFTLSPDLTLNTGLRADYIESHADQTTGTLAAVNIDETDQNLSGGIGAVYKMHPNVRLLANTGRAFKAPTLQERFFRGTAQGRYVEGNPNLKNETSLNLDLGVRFQSEMIEGSAQVFQNRIDNFIVMNKFSTTAPDSFLYDNVGKAELYGGEIQFSVRPVSKVQCTAVLNYVRGRDAETDENLPKIPPLNGLLELQIGSLQSKWIGIASRFVQTQEDVASNESRTGGYALINLSAGIRLANYFSGLFPVTITVNVHNVFDRSYRDHLSNITWWDAPGRNVVVNVRGEL